MGVLFVIGAIVVLIWLSAFFGAPYVPSHRRDVRQLFDNDVPLSSDDVVLDIGSGDGLVLREVSRRGARAVGYEIHPFFVAIAKLASLGDGRVRIRWCDAWRTPFPADVTIVYIFGVGRDGRRTARLIQRQTTRLGRGVTVACYGNPLPEVPLLRESGAYYLYRFEPLHP